MEWVLLGLVADLLVACGLLAYAYYRFHGSPAKNTPSIPYLPPAAVEENGDWLDRLASKVEDDIDCHSFHMEQIATDLRDVTGNTPDVVLKAAAHIIIANRRLQRDLAAAQKEIQQQRQEVASLVAEARTDTLTALPNRRSFDEELGRRFDQWKRHQIPLSLLMVDVDRFKQLNDAHGHQTGDDALRLLAGVLRKTLREMDLAARFGGEEFAVLLPGTRLKDATTVAERLRASVAKESFHCRGKDLNVTVSLGLASVIADDDAQALVKRADDALYAAKSAGRNCAFLHDGTNAIAIPADLGVVRQPFTEKQYIAPYAGHDQVPEAEMFRAVQCHDLSAGGFSYLCDEPPDFQTFVVRLGKAHEQYYVVARVANVVDVGQPDNPRYRVGCTFLERVRASGGPAITAPAKVSPIVIADPQTGLLSFPTLSGV